LTYLRSIYKRKLDGFPDALKWLMNRQTEADSARRPTCSQIAVLSIRFFNETLLQIHQHLSNTRKGRRNV